MSSHRILLVDDHQDIHDVVRTILRGVQDIQLIGEAYSGEDGIVLCKELQPELVLMDVVMPGIGGAGATKRILAENSQLKILAISSFREYEYIKAILDSGALGYIVKDALTEDLLTTIRNTVKGNTVLSAEVARVIFSTPPSQPPISVEAPHTDFGLTEREREVLKLIAEGQTNSQIAAILKISPPTVRFHYNNILLKLGVETRSEMLVLASKNNLV